MMGEAFPFDTENFRNFKPTGTETTTGTGIATVTTKTITTVKREQN